jgi:hypothetical protein
MAKKIHSDDNLVAVIVHEFFERNRNYPTLTKITACFNISVGLIRTCCVRGDRKDLTKLANQFHKELIKEIDSLCEE